MLQDRIFVLGVTQIVVGLSTIVKVSPTAYQSAGSLKIDTRGGTLGILELVNGTTAGGTTGWGIGYPVALTEVVNIGGPATFYLAASGATVTAAMTIGRTVGATIV